MNEKHNRQVPLHGATSPKSDMMLLLMWESVLWRKVVGLTIQDKSGPTKQEELPVCGNKRSWHPTCTFRITCCWARLHEGKSPKPLPRPWNRLKSCCVIHENCQFLAAEVSNIWCITVHELNEGHIPEVSNIRFIMVHGLNEGRITPYTDIEFQLTKYWQDTL